MTHWNHRIVKYRPENGGGYGLHEVYYDDDGKECGMTENPICFAVHEDEGPEGLIKSLELALKDAIEKAVLEEPETWSGDPWVTALVRPEHNVIASSEQEVHNILQAKNGAAE